MIWLAVVGWMLTFVFLGFAVAFMRLADDVLDTCDEALAGWKRSDDRCEEALEGWRRSIRRLT